MKMPLIALAMASLLSSVAMPTSADAANARVENALKERSDLSSFYQALVNTGVINELKEGTGYTIIAPNNEAFAQLTPRDYPCLYSVQCRAQTADLLRNHIVASEHNLDDVADHRDAMFSIDNRALNVARPAKSQYSIEGKNVVDRRGMFGGQLYTIDGVIANERELVAFMNLRNAPTVYVPPTASIQIDESAYAPAAGGLTVNEPGTVTRTTTTVTRTVTTPAE